VVLLLAGCGGKQESPESVGESEAVSESDQAGETMAQESGQEEGGQQETEQQTQEEQEENTGVPTAEVGKKRETELKNERNVVLLRTSSSTISVTIPGNQEAEDAVNAFFADREASWKDTVLEYRDMAKEDLAMFEEQEMADGWHGYEMGKTYTVMRADEQMISIVEDSYEYTGGAHPNSVRVAYNFDTKTGQRMGLKDVASDLDEIRTESTRYLGEMLPQSEYAGELFEDYASHLDDILTDGTWYTDEAGFHIICNEYIITPHSSGILDFVLPYGEVDVVRSDYIPKQP